MKTGLELWVENSGLVCLIFFFFQRELKLLNKLENAFALYSSVLLQLSPACFIFTSYHEDGGHNSAQYSLRGRTVVGSNPSGTMIASCLGSFGSDRRYI